MFKHCINMERIAQVSKWGNSGGVLLPREWLGKQVKVILVDRTDQIRKEIMAILDSYLEDILGIYLIGSYARGEQEKDSDIDIIVISKDLRKKITSGKYNIEIYPLKNIKKTLKNNPLMIFPSLIEAKPILNKSLLEEISLGIPSKSDFYNYMEECRRILKINKSFIQLDKNKELFSEYSVIYSTLLRLRGVYFVNVILQGKNYRKREFLGWLSSEGKLDVEDVEEVYDIYKKVRDDQNPRKKLRIEILKKLLELLEKEVNKYD